MAQTDPDLLHQFAALDSAAISDALDQLGLPSGFGGISPMWGQPRIVGFAVTVQLAALAVASGNRSHIATTAVNSAGPTDVLVVANAGRTDVSCWGGLLSLAAVRRGIRGVVADGACRDVAQARALGFPVFAQATTPRTARGRLRQVSTGQPVVIGEVTVAPGDIVIADEIGIAIVARPCARDVLCCARRLVDREQAIAEELRAGASLRETMHDARLAGTEAAP